MYFLNCQYFSRWPAFHIRQIVLNLNYCYSAIYRFRWEYFLQNWRIRVWLEKQGDKHCHPTKFVTHRHSLMLYNILILYDLETYIYKWQYNKTIVSQRILRESIYYYIPAGDTWVCLTNLLVSFDFDVSGVIGTDACTLRYNVSFHLLMGSGR